MEMTMLARFCMAQNIRTLVKGLPTHLQGVAESFTKAFDSDGRGTLQEEIGSYSGSKATFENISKTTKLPVDLYNLLLQKNPNNVPFRRALMQTHIDFRRKRYATSEHSAKESFVVFRDDKDAWRAGQITHIIVQRDYSHEEPKYETSIVVQKFSTLRKADALHDPYLAQERREGLGCLCYTTPRAPKVLISVGDIVCHSMCLANHFPEVSEDSMHVMPLLRVSIRISTPKRLLMMLPCTGVRTIQYIYEVFLLRPGISLSLTSILLLDTSLDSFARFCLILLLFLRRGQLMFVLSLDSRTCNPSR